MADMLARADRAQQNKCRYRNCECGKSRLYFARGGPQTIRRRNRAVDKRAWTREADEGRSQQA